MRLTRQERARPQRKAAPGRTRQWLKAGIGATTLAVVLSACAGNAKQSTLTPKGSQARQLNSLFFPVFWIAVGVFCLVAGLVAFAVVRFRARSDDEAPRQIHGHTRLELTWTILPALLLAGIAIPTVKMVFDVNRYPANAMRIDVTGHRWWWQFQYPGTSVNTATELHIPTGQKVVLVIGSDDVIHNFWVPELNGKIYAIPGRHNNLTIEADNPGTYYGQCAEFCGTSHANMRFRVVAQSPADYQTWLQRQEQQPSVESHGDRCRRRRPAVHDARVRRLPHHPGHLRRRGRPRPHPFQEPQLLRRLHPPQY